MSHGCGLACVLFFALVLELNAGMLSPLTQCFGVGVQQTQVKKQTFGVSTTLALRGGDTTDAVDTISQDIAMPGNKKSQDKRGNIINLLKSLLSGKLAHEEENAILDSVASTQSKTVDKAPSTQSKTGKSKRVDDGWVEISASEVMNSEVLNSEVANNDEHEQLEETKAVSEEEEPAAIFEDEPVAGETVQEVELATETGAEPGAVEQEQEYQVESDVPLRQDSELDSAMFESAMAETAAVSADVQGELSQMKSKVSSLRRTQSELEIKMARYNGLEVAEDEGEDEALPEELDLQMMKQLLDGLRSKQEVLSSRVEELTHNAAEALVA